MLRVYAAKLLPHFRLEVELALPDTGIHALVGPSGAGKSTLLRLIAGLDAPDSGSIQFKGQVWADSSSRVRVPAYKRPVGMVFQDFALFPHFSVMQNVLFACPDASLAEPLLRALGVWPLRSAKPDRISGGERQRVAICQALARKPRLLLLDEPFAALDPATRRSLGALLRETADTLGLPMILVTHDLEEALTLSDSILALVDGKVSPGWLEGQLDELERKAFQMKTLLKQKNLEVRLSACA